MQIFRTFKSGTFQIKITRLVFEQQMDRNSIIRLKRLSIKNANAITCKIIFTSFLGHVILPPVEYLFSPLVTEVWELENGSNKIIQPTLQDGDYYAGIALNVVEKDFCKK